MSLSWIQTGLIWYYFNIIVIAVIIYMLLRVSYERMRMLQVNKAEASSKEDRFIYKVIVFTAIFVLAYFFWREIGRDVHKAFDAMTEYIRDNYGK